MLDISGLIADLLVLPPAARAIEVNDLMLRLAQVQAEALQESTEKEKAPPVDLLGALRR